MTGKPQKTWKFGLSAINIQNTTCLSEASRNIQFSSPSPGFPRQPLHLLSTGLLLHPPPPASQPGSFQSHNTSLPPYYSQSGFWPGALPTSQLDITRAVLKVHIYSLFGGILKTRQLRDCVIMLTPKMLLMKLSLQVPFSSGLDQFGFFWIETLTNDLRCHKGESERGGGIQTLRGSCRTPALCPEGSASFRDRFSCALVLEFLSTKLNSGEKSLKSNISSQRCS